MNNSLIRNYTTEFEDIVCVLTELKALRKKEMQLRRRLKTLKEKYSFIEELVGINNSGDKISSAIKAYFKAFGFNKIEIVPEKDGKEDLRLWFDDKLLIIEATGTEKKDNNEGKAHQISKHIPLRQQEFPKFKVFGVFISNHDNKKIYNQRNPKSFDKRLIQIAESHNYTVTTTVDLFNAFILFKKGRLMPKELIDKLCITGELKILESS